ncbi:MAG: phospholipid-binding protein MlaC [Rhodothermales bacterium]
MLNIASVKNPTMLLLAGLLMMGFFIAPVEAQTPEQEIRAMLEQRDQEIKQAIQPLIEKTATAEQRKRVEDMVNDVIDFEEMGRVALGRYWADLTEAQRAEFIDVFADIVRSQSLADPNIYNAAVAYDEVKVVADSAYVKTTTVYQDKSTVVEYTMGAKNGTWWITDIILDEVSTVGSYVRSFQTAIRKRGFEGLMKSLYKKREKLQTSS